MFDPEGSIIVFRARTAAACRERAFVLTAVGIAHATGRMDGAFILAVPAERAAAAIDELQRYEVERRDWPKPRRRWPLHPYDLTGLFVVALVLLFTAAASGKLWFGFDWFDAGRVSTDLVRRGEWWRAVTGLTLHLSAGHLIGNIILGAILGMFAGRVFGHGVAWFSIVLAGAAGNLVSALIQHAGHSAVGASTAVFAALGLLGATGWRRRHGESWPWALRLAPFVVAAVLLAMTGSGGPRTDVISHLVGFAAGSGLGAIYGGFAPTVVVGRRGQWAFGAAAMALVAGCWAIALATHGR